VLFNQRFLSVLFEGNWWKSAFSLFTVFSCAVCCTITVFKPFYFVLAVGLCGLVLGLKLFQIASNHKQSKISMNYFRTIAWQAVGNVLVLCLIGLGIVYYVESAVLDDKIVKNINIMFFPMAIILTYFMLLVRQFHITKIATAKMLAVYDRTTVREDDE
jgi:hypothetical protein